MARHRQSDNLVTTQITDRLGKLEALLDNGMASIMQGIAGILEGDVEDAFESEWNPSTHQKWVDLDDATKKQRAAIGKYPGKILQVRGELADRVTSDYGDKFARVGVKSAGADDYAAAMQFGRPDKNIPARPYLPWEGLHPDTAARVIAFLDEEIAAIVD